MTHRTRELLICTALVAAALTPAAPAQQRDVDPEAARAFQAMVEAYRARPALTVKTEIKVTMGQDGAEGEGPGVKAELTFDKERRGVFRLRGYECFIAGGEITAIHGDGDAGYFSMPDEGSPYYALMNMFIDLPFPHLAIAFGEAGMDDLYMQFHSKAPWIVPTGVRQDMRDDVTVDIIEMTSDIEHLEIALDPETKLIQSIDLKITGGFMVQAGAMLRYRHTFEYETHDEPLRDDFFAFEPGNRQRVDMLASLEPKQAPAQGGLVGKAAPAFVLESITGDIVDLEDLQGQVVVLDFWATWCGPCVQAMPLLHEVAAWASDQTMPVRVFAVNTFEGNSLRVDSPEARREKAAAFWQQKGFTLPVLMDYSDETAAAYGVSGIPATFIIRSDGIVHAQHTGFGADYAETLKREIAEALEALEAGDNDGADDDGGR